MPAVRDMEQAQLTEVVGTHLKWGTVSEASKKGTTYLADFNLELW